MAKRSKIIVVGSGASGCSAAISAVESGADVLFVSMDIPSRSDSASVRDGYNSAGTPGGPLIEKHVEATLAKGGNGLTRDEAGAMCEAAPFLLSSLVRMGVPFDRTSEGFIKFYRSSDSDEKFTAKSGVRTGQKVISALEGQLARWIRDGRITAHFGWEFLSPIVDDKGACKGIVALNMNSMEVRTFAASAVIICTGFFTSVFERSTASSYCDGSAIVSCAMHGAKTKNISNFFFHPHTLSVFGKNIAVADSLVLQGAVFDDKGSTYIDLKNFDTIPDDPSVLDFIELCAIATGEDPLTEKVRLVPAAASSLGGLDVNLSHEVNGIKGLFAAGGAACIYKGNGILFGNRLLTSIYGGLVAGKSAATFAAGLTEEIQQSLSNSAKAREEDAIASLKSREFQQQAEHDEIGNSMSDISSRLFATMWEHFGPSAKSGKSADFVPVVSKLKESFSKTALRDRSSWANSELSFAVRLSKRIALAEMMGEGV